MLAITLISLLLSIAVTSRRDKSLLYNRITLLSLVITVVICCKGLTLLSLNAGLSIYAGYFTITSLTHIMHIFLFILSGAIISLTSFYPRENRCNLKKPSYLANLITNKFGDSYKIMEYPLILLFITTGAAFLMISSDLVSLFITLELQSYGLYLLASIHRNSELSTSAGLIYFLLGGFSSCFILLGIALLYANSGITNLHSYCIITNYNPENYTYYLDHFINYSFLLISLGFLFKLSAAPFHFWSPDVYDAIPSLVTTFVAIIAKISLFSFLYFLIEISKSNPFTLGWTYSLYLSTIFSLLIGTILGLNQSRIKKLFAYSTISHVGFILLALSLNSVESSQAFVFYLISYSITNLNAFFLLITIGYSLYFLSVNPNLTNASLSQEVLLEKNNSPLQLISQLKGYFFNFPFLALSFAITIYSFVGIPPLMGFFAKQIVLSACLDKGYYSIALIAILTSVISAVYYLKIIQKIFMEKNDQLFTYEISLDKGKFNFKSYLLSDNLTFIISVLTMTILLFLFSPHEIFNLCLIIASN